MQSETLRIIQQTHFSFHRRESTQNSFSTHSKLSSYTHEQISTGAYITSKKIIDKIQFSLSSCVENIKLKKMSGISLGIYLILLIAQNTPGSGFTISLRRNNCYFCYGIKTACDDPEEWQRVECDEEQPYCFTFEYDADGKD